MGERRMLTRKVTDDDHFMSLSSSAQALYLHLSMSADDDGFCNQISLCMFKAHASVGDLEALLSLRYLYQFESGVIVIKHWRMANALRKDRYTPTVWQKEFSMLKLKENGSYTLGDDGCQMVANRLPDGCPNISKDKLSKDKPINSSDRKRFTPPTMEEVQAYCIERKNRVNPEKFIDYYTANGWRVGKNPMKDWRAAVRTWEKGDKEKGRMSARQQDYYDKWHPECEQGRSVVDLDEIALSLEDL